MSRRRFRSSDTRFALPWGGRLAVLALVLALVLGMATGGLPTSAVASEDVGPSITEVYPNTIYPGNVGEYVRVTFPEATDLTGWSITAGTTTAALPNATVRGPVAFTTNASVTSRIVDGRVHELDDHFTIAEDGGTVRLLHRGMVVDEVRYGSAPVARRWVRRDGRWGWRPHGMTTFEARSFEAESATVFPFPDAAGQPEVILDGADERLLLAGYTLESRSTVDTLLAVERRGVPVRVLVDGSPVGGQSEREAAALDSLARNGTEVRVFDGPRGRYRYHHAKYAVVDNTVIVLTENWKPAGIGGRASRGWGVAIHSPSAADAVASIFEADVGWKDTVPWIEYRHGRSFVDEPPADGEFPSAFDPKTVPVDSVRVIAAPDNAESAVIALIDGAESTLDVQQVRVSDANLPFLRATIRAAERGVRVRLLLDHSWYVVRENRRLARRLNELAARQSLPLEVRVVEPRSRFGKIHTKGVIVDERHALVGSINWNNNSVRNNRELAVIVTGEEIAGYYAAVFQSDWQGGRWVTPIGFVGAVAAAGLSAGAIGRRRIRFVTDRREASSGWESITEAFVRAVIRPRRRRE